MRSQNATENMLNKLSGEGSCLQNGGLTLLLISLPADSTTVTTANITNTVDPGKTNVAAVSFSFLFARLGYSCAQQPKKGLTPVA